MGEVESGECEICGKVGSLSRTYIHFDYKCQCHSPTHFILIRHCKDHTPSFVKQLSDAERTIEALQKEMELVLSCEGCIHTRGLDCRDNCETKDAFDKMDKEPEEEEKHYIEEGYEGGGDKSVIGR
ncbi:hypothetical protein LCGC14_2238800 [marine sediment metagenome]|uniref:Uncharacterized protein n=1 Tax=marine sediment metagenome TaxID=412755 RepID=A0A0F9D5T2_9ZZZZ